MKHSRRFILGMGMRTMKTAVAVMICLATFELIKVSRFNTWISNMGSAQLPTSFYACTAAIICMRDTVVNSIKQGARRLIGTAIGGVIGLLLLLFNGVLSGSVASILITGAGIIACISLCNIFKNPEASAICCVVLIAIMMNHSEADRYLYAAYRIVETAFGIFVAVLVNKLLDFSYKSEKAQKTGEESQL